MVPRSHKREPADLGSRGGDVLENELWQHGPAWLYRSSKMAARDVPEASAESKAEEKPSSRVLVTMNTTPENVFDQILEKYSLRKTLRLGEPFHPSHPEENEVRRSDKD